MNVMNLYKIINANMYSQTGVWEQGRSPVGGDCYHTILTSNRQLNLTSLIGAMAIAPYGFSKNPKHYNLTYFSQKLFFNVKIYKNYQGYNS